MQALRFLLSRWVLSFVGIAILAVLVWLFGPLIPSFESWVPRLAVVIAGWHGRCCQVVTAGNLTIGSLLKGAIVSRLM